MKQKLEGILKDVLAGKNPEERERILNNVELLFDELYKDVLNVIYALKDSEEPPESASTAVESETPSEPASIAEDSEKLPELVSIEDPDSLLDKIGVDPSRSYSYEKAAKLMQKRSPLYTTKVLRSMVASDDLVSEDEQITGKSLIEHIEYMRGKRLFLYEIKEMIEQIKKKTKLSEKYIAEQVRRGAVDFLGKPRINVLEVVVLDDDAIYEMIKEGRWMTAKEIKEAGSEYDLVYIGQLIRRNSEKLRSKKYGRPWIGYITPETEGIFGIEVKTETVKSLVEVMIGKSKTGMYPNKPYSREDVKRVLLKVHPGVFSVDATIDNVIQSFGTGDVVYGSKLIEFINKTNGMMNLSSTSTQLGLKSLLGMSYTEIVEFLEHEDINRFVHTMPEIFEWRYVRKGDLEELKKTFDNVVGEVIATRSEYHLRLSEKGIMPNKKDYEMLLKIGVLNNRSKEGIERTYTAFEEAMKGFKYYDFNMLRLSFEMEWEDFIEGPMKKLEGLGIVREIVSYLNIKHNYVFYVVDGDRENEISPVLNLRSLSKT